MRLVRIGCFLLSLFATTSMAYNRLFMELDVHDAEKLLKDHYTLKKQVFFNPSVRTSNEESWNKAEIKTRGQHCLYVAKRKCFNVKLENSVQFKNSISPDLNIKTKKFYLISMWEDQGYIHTRIGQYLYGLMGLFPAKHQYLELIINGKSQGLYTIVEKFDRSIKRTYGATFVGKRGKFNNLETKEFVENSDKTEDDYKDAYKEIYQGLSKYKGHRLYEFLTSRMNIDRYFDWLALSSFLKNGDYSDEVYFFNTPREDGKIFFDIAGWDFDDLFSTPHVTITNWWNFVLKKRIRTSLLYSMENSLDRKIYQDSFLYNKFKKRYKRMLTTIITADTIQNLTQKITGEISEYLDNEKVLQNSEKDKTEIPYTKEKIMDLLNSRQKDMLQKRNELLNSI